MKISSQAGNRSNKAFTLIEMIGVLAVIAILAAVLIPKVFQAINDARVNNAAMTVGAVKTAIADHYAKAGSLVVIVTNNVTATLGLPMEQFDKVLVAEQFMDKPFQTKIGDNILGAGNTRVRAFDISTAGFTNNAAVDGTIATGFALGNTNSVNDMVGATGIEAVITGVTAGDAKDLNDRLDGPSLGSAINLDDFKGRVKYIAGSPTIVYIYLTHR